MGEDKHGLGQINVDNDSSTILGTNMLKHHEYHE